jgi:hypothetical protein
LLLVLQAAHRTSGFFMMHYFTLFSFQGTTCMDDHKYSTLSEDRHRWKYSAMSLGTVCHIYVFQVYATFLYNITFKLPCQHNHYYNSLIPRCCLWQLILLRMSLINRKATVSLLLTVANLLAPFYCYQ